MKGKQSIAACYLTPSELRKYLRELRITPLLFLLHYYFEVAHACAIRLPVLFALSVCWVMYN